MNPGRRQISTRAEARLFWHIRGCWIVNSLRQSIRRSRLSRLGVLAVLSIVMWVMLLAASVVSFQFLVQVFPDAAALDEAVRTIYSVYFGSLMVMLLASSGVLLYSSLYRSDEARFLLTLPARAQRVFLHKLQESTLFGSWNFLLLGSPLLVAHGIVQSAAWTYYAALLPLLVAFVCIPCSLGALCCLLIVRWLPTYRVQWLSAVGLVLVVAMGVAGRGAASRLSGEPLSRAWLEALLAEARFSQCAFLPNGWLSSGLTASIRGGLADAAGREALLQGGLYLALLAACAAVCHHAAVWTAGRMYREGYVALDLSRGTRRVALPRRLSCLGHAVSRLLPATYRLLIFKDLRMFRRDPVQWSQFTVFVVLLLIYFASTHKLSEGRRYAAWTNMISFVNLAIIGLILSSFTIRFVFPMISLEGRRFWILGLLPIRRASILWGKFVFGTAGAVVPCGLLIGLSDWLLGVTPALVLLHFILGAAMCVGLAGIAVGLGARFPEMRQDSPARIAAGFGGTLALIASMTYVLLLITLLAAPCHFLFAGHSAPGAAEFSPELVRVWLAVDAVLALLLAAAATAVPLVIGYRAFQRLEF